MIDITPTLSAREHVIENILGRFFDIFDLINAPQVKLQTEVHSVLSTIWLCQSRAENEWIS